MIELVAGLVSVTLSFIAIFFTNVGKEFAIYAILLSVILACSIKIFRMQKDAKKVDDNLKQCAKKAEDYVNRNKQLKAENEKLNDNLFRYECLIYSIRNKLDICLMDQTPGERAQIQRLNIYIVQCEQIIRENK